MIFPTDYDLRISRLYSGKRPEHFVPDLYRSTYGFLNLPESSPKDPPRSIWNGVMGVMGFSLEKKLVDFASQYDLTNTESWRAIDRKAYNQIMMCLKCRRDHKLRRHYYNLYKSLIQPYWDLLDGKAILEEQEEEFNLI